LNPPVYVNKGLWHNPSNVFEGKTFSPHMTNIERFTAKDSKFAEGLEGKEFDFGDKIQYPLTYPLEFKGKASKFADGLEGKEFDFGDKIQYPLTYPLEFNG
jgi:hypothetical protein